MAANTQANRSKSAGGRKARRRQLPKVFRLPQMQVGGGAWVARGCGGGAWVARGCARAGARAQAVLRQVVDDAMMACSVFLAVCVCACVCVRCSVV